MMAFFRKDAISIDGISIKCRQCGFTRRRRCRMLSDTRIHKAKPRSTPYQLTNSRGLYLWITPAGGFLWRWKYRFNGIQKQMSFGLYPDVSIPDARERHAEARKLLAAGTDPMAQRKADKATRKELAADSFKTVAQLWHEHWKDGNSTHHVKATWSRLESNVFPAIGGVAITEIEAPAIVRMVKAIQDRGKLDIAKRALETTGQVFRYAVAHGHAKRNPAADIKPADILKSRQKINHARVDAKELPALLRAIEVYQGKHVTRLAMKLMALTFVRTSELISGRWYEIDFDAKRWNIPADRMKMRTPHIVPLAIQAIEVLELLRTITGGSELLFPGDRHPMKPMSNMTILEALKRMGYKGDMTGHGFRGLAATTLNENGFEEQHVDLQLAHMKRNRVTAAYNHAKYLKQRTIMMQWWGDYVEQSLRGGKLPEAI
jgi:integrase